MVERWDKVSSQVVSDHRIMKLRQDSSRSPRTGKTHSFFILESNDWINVIPITSEGSVILIHQFRHGTGELTLEIPGGMVDDEDGSARTSAIRELREETGFVADKMIPIGSVHPNPAFLTNRCHTFLALDVRLEGQTQFDAAEDIQIEAFDLTDVPSLISSGRITHSLVVAAFYHLERYKQLNPDWWESAGSGNPGGGDDGHG